MTLTIRANDQRISVGSALPALTFSASGFVLGEDSVVLDSLPSASTTACSASPAGVYPILMSGGSATNYRLTLIDGLLTIVPSLNNPKHLFIPLLFDGVVP